MSLSSSSYTGEAPPAHRPGRAEGCTIMTCPSLTLLPMSKGVAEEDDSGLHGEAQLLSLPLVQCLNLGAKKPTAPTLASIPTCFHSLHSIVSVGRTSAIEQSENCPHDKFNRHTLCIQNELQTFKTLGAYIPKQHEGYQSI